MPNQKPNKFLAPVIIAGVTIGFLASAYKFIFATPKQEKNSEQKSPDSEIHQEQAAQPEPSSQQAER